MPGPGTGCEQMQQGVDSALRRAQDTHTVSKTPGALKRALMQRAQRLPDSEPSLHDTVWLDLPHLYTTAKAKAAQSCHSLHSDSPWLVIDTYYLRAA